MVILNKVRRCFISVAEFTFGFAVLIELNNLRGALGKSAEYGTVERGGEGRGGEEVGAMCLCPMFVCLVSVCLGSTPNEGSIDACVMSHCAFRFG